MKNSNIFGTHGYGSGSEKIYNCVDELLMEGEREMAERKSRVNEANTSKFKEKKPSKPKPQSKKPNKIDQISMPRPLTTSISRQQRKRQTPTPQTQTQLGGSFPKAPSVPLTKQSFPVTKPSSQTASPVISTRPFMPTESNFPLGSRLSKLVDDDIFNRVKEEKLDDRSDFKLKKTFSGFVEEEGRGNVEEFLEIEADRNQGSPTALLPQTKMQQYIEPTALLTNNNITYSITKPIKRSSSTNKPQVSFNPFPLPQPQPNTPHTKPSSPNFHLSYQQIQFISLLYPKQSPQSLMLKLLSYYEQQQVFKNSFEQIVQQNSRELVGKKKKFFNTRVNLEVQNNENDYTINVPHQSIDDDDDRQFTSMKERDYDNSIERFSQQDQPLFVPYRPHNDKQYNPTTLNQYTQLKEQCLSALGSQMVQTQLKSSSVQTANVNYYTRQYAMPIILEEIKEKNLQSRQKLSRLKQKTQRFSMQTQQHSQTPFQQSSNLKTNQSFHSRPTYSTLPQQLIHKIYIPANSRGQSFQPELLPDQNLFRYVPQNDYRRILRDINHLIQKVLTYHRHNSFLKKKNSFLMKGWNLALLVTLVVILVGLFVESCDVFGDYTQYAQIIVFFLLSFTVILILGNAFNNYRKTVKRSSLIKDICDQITNYLEFINCSSKRVKWVLGKDFFWLQVWIYIPKGSTL